MVSSRPGICCTPAFPPHQRNHRDHREFRNDGTFRPRPGPFGKRVPSLPGTGTKKPGLEVAAQVPQPLVYKGQKLEVGYRIDLAVEGRGVVEVKSVDAIHPIHQDQLLSYMRLSGLSVGLLINFNVLHLRDGIKRMVNGQDWQK
jgi:GxxExxY protein